MKKVNYILATGLMAQENITDNLAKAIEACPRLAEFLADPGCPEPTFEEVQKRVEKYSDDKVELIEFSFKLGSDLTWNCHYKYQRPVYYKTQEDATDHNSRFRTSPDETYTIRGTYQSSSWLEW